MNFYSNVFSRGEYLYHRYFDENVDKIEKIKMEPWYFLHCNHETGYKDIYDNNVQKFVFSNVKDYRDNRRLMIDSGQEVLGQENLELLYLADLYPGKVNFNPDLIRIASIDIETVSKEGFPYPNEAKMPIDAISHIDSVTKEIWLFSTRKWDRNKSTLSKEILSRAKYKYFESEKEMLLEYLNFWKSNYPHIVTGWNIDNYDIQYMVNRYNKLFGENITKQFSPFGYIGSRLADNSKEDDENPERTYSFAGITILDYLALYKKFRITARPSYKLDYIAEIELNENKLEYDGPLWKLAEDDPQRYCDYNIQDTLLIEKLDNKLKFLLLAISLSYYAKINFEKVLSPVTTWDAIIFNSLLNDNIIVPMKKSHSKETFVGAYVKEPEVGHRYGWVVSVDLTSLYPSIIRQWNISPETIVGRADDASIDDYLNKRVNTSREHSQAANGMLYRKDKRGIIPIEIEKVFFQRKQHKNNEFFAKKVNEVIGLSIKLYNDLAENNENLYCFMFVGKTEKEIQDYINSMSKDDMKLAYEKIDNDFKILHKYIK